MCGIIMAVAKVIVIELSVLEMLLVGVVVKVQNQNILFFIADHSAEREIGHRGLV